MKIGLLTLHYPLNYGALLQTYALFSHIQNKNIDIEIINYTPHKNSLINNYYPKINSIKTLLNAILKTLFINDYIHKKNKFNSFSKNHLKLTRRYSIISDILLNYDIVLTGSDQVFNLNFKNRLVYFQPFRKNNNQKKIAYAPSFGVSDFNLKFCKEIQPHIDDFDFLSCREIDGVSFLESMCSKKIYHVLDPVFLLKKTCWEKISSKAFSKDKYIFIYDLNGKKKLIDFANKIKSDQKIYILSNDPLASIKREYKHVDKFIRSAGIDEFISLISYADAVITDSFHGTAMSIIFQTPFYTYISLDKAASRITSLLKEFSMENRIINSANNDYPEISERPDISILESKIMESKSYLHKAIYE